MAEASRIQITWTPDPNATSQQLQRATSTSGPWATIATLNGTANSYTDTTTDDTPHTEYYYRLNTTCASGATNTSPTANDTAKNCPTSGITDIFGLKNNRTDASGVLNFTYYDMQADWSNNNYGTSHSTSRTLTVDNQGYIPLVCHKCAEDVTYALAPPFGSGTADGTFSHMSVYPHVACYLPTSPTNLGGTANNNMGDVLRKLDINGTPTTGPSSGYFQLGVNQYNAGAFYPFRGTAIGTQSASGVTYSSTYPIYDLRTIPTTGANLGFFSAIRIHKNRFGTNANQSTGLAALTGTNVYAAIVDEGFIATSTSVAPYKCHVHLWKLERNYNYDTYTTGQPQTPTNLQSYGFNMTSYSYIVNPSNDYQVFRSLYEFDLYSEASPQPSGTIVQPTVYIKIFTL